MISEKVSESNRQISGEQKDIKSLLQILVESSQSNSRKLDTLEENIKSINSKLDLVLTKMP